MKTFQIIQFAALVLFTSALQAQTPGSEEPKSEAKPAIIPPSFQMDSGVPMADWKTIPNPFRTKAKVVVSAPSPKQPEILSDSFEVISVAKFPTAQGTMQKCLVVTPGDSHGVRQLTAAPRIIEDQEPTDDETDESSFSMGGTRVWFVGIRGTTPAFWVEGTPKAETSLKFPKLKEARSVAERQTKSTRHIRGAETTSNLVTSKSKTGGKPTKAAKSENLEQFLSNLGDQDSGKH